MCVSILCGMCDLSRAAGCHSLQSHSLILEGCEFFSLCSFSFKGKDVGDPYRELFIWAVLNNMGEMAVCFWKRGKDPLVKSLIGGMIFEEMAKLAYGEHMPDDIIDKIKVNSK